MLRRRGLGRWCDAIHGWVPCIPGGGCACRGVVTACICPLYPSQAEQCAHDDAS